MKGKFSSSDHKNSDYKNKGKNKLIKDNSDGLVWVEDGQLKTKDPRGLGRYPRISAGKNVMVYVDGEGLSEDEEIVINSKNRVKIREINKEKRIAYKIDISEDRMKAYLIIEIKPYTKYRVIDTAPASFLLIRAELIEESYPEIPAEKIKDDIKKMGISYGIRKEELSRALNTRKTGKYLIAEGKRPKEGEDARVILVKNKELDYDNAFNVIESFAIGEVIAVKTPAVNGNPGFNVLGEKIIPPEPRDFELIAGDGVSLTGNNKAIALKNGMPEVDYLKDKCLIEILPEYVLEGDVDKKTGSLKYEGDLIIKGSISDYYNVRIGNNLRVSENIANAEVITGGSVFVKGNIISSKIKAGEYINTDIIKRMIFLSKKINQLESAINEIINRATDKEGFLKDNIQVGRILKLLMQDKFKVIITEGRKIKEELEKENPGADIIEGFESFLNVTENYKKLLQMNNLNHFIQFNEDLKEVIIGQENVKASNVYTDYIQNSVINTSGNVILKNKGCYNSKIIAAGDIIAPGKQGALRGGLYSANNIYAREISSGLSKTYIHIKKSFYVSRIVGDVVIKAPEDSLNVSDRETGVNIFVDEQGRIKNRISRPNLEEIKHKCL